MDLTDQERAENREKIRELLKSVNRKNTHKLLYFLDHSGYYNLYGSFKHHAYKGGLAEHSLEVLDYALEHNEHCSKDSIIIAALLHDICKTKYEFPEGVEFYGHGRKSVDILEQFIEYELTEDERNAIRFHMGRPHTAFTEEEKEAYKKATTTELWNLIHAGDCLSAGHYPKSTQGILGRIFSMLR